LFGQKYERRINIAWLPRDIVDLGVSLGAEYGDCVAIEDNRRVLAITVVKTGNSLRRPSE
jgi:hypothetical protein